MSGRSPGAPKAYWMSGGPNVLLFLKKKELPVGRNNPIVQLPVTADAGATTKLVFETSKKTVPTACTLMPAAVVDTLGPVIVSLPSLGVLSARTMGKVFPP